jgi:hypothetical protein
VFIPFSFSIIGCNTIFYSFSHKKRSNVVILGVFPVEVITEQLLTMSEFVILDNCFLFHITFSYSTFFLAIQVAVQFPNIVSTGADHQLPKSNASEALWKDRPSSSICAMLRTMESKLATSGKNPRGSTWTQKKMPSSRKKMISCLFSLSLSQLLHKRSAFWGTCDPHHPS